MRLTDQLAFCLGAMREHRLRAGLSMLGIAIGVGSVVLLTAIGDGARSYVVAEFQQFGTNILQVTPGKTETFGIPGVMGGTTNKLTIDDSEAIRRVRGVERVAAVVLGQARVASEGRGRSVYVYGVTSDALDVWRMSVRQGSFIPAGDPRRGAGVVVLGTTLKRELFGDRNAVGQWVRVAGRRLRVIGILEPRGRVLGFDMDDSAWVPVSVAMGMFNLDELLEIDVTFTNESLTDSVVAGIKSMLRDRHDDTEDFTVFTQAAMLGVFDTVLRAITIGVALIAAVSLLVGVIGILTVMWISVGERTHEIGLVRALGATVAQVRRLFLVEAATLAGIGAVVGMGGALLIAHGVGWLLPHFPVSTPLGFAAIALVVSSGAGIVFGIAPARRAALLDPVDALRDE